MNADILQRTKLLARDVAVFCEGLSPRDSFRGYSRQLYRCSSSVGVNYRAACRAKPTADFINKLKIVEEECDETMFLIELIILVKSDLKSSVDSILKEANEILSRVVSSINTLRKKSKKV